jgi:hypothetical protein
MPDVLLHFRPARDPVPRFAVGACRAESARLGRQLCGDSGQRGRVGLEQIGGAESAQTRASDKERGNR